MITIQRILFPTDFSRCANQAFVQAVQLAKRHGAELHVLHAYVPYEDHTSLLTVVPAAPEVRPGATILTPPMLQVLEQQQAQTLRITQNVVRDISVGPVIIDYAREHEVDLIVMGTHGRRGIGHLFLGSVAEEIVRFAPCPVFTIRETMEPHEAGAFRKILVPVDFSKHAEQAVRYAKELAILYGAELQLLHIVEEQLHPALYATGRSSIFEFMPEIETTSVREIERMLMDSGGPEVQVEIHIREGRAARDIVKFAESHASDLIVIATHGLTGIEHLLLGSVTEKVVRFSRVPVFTVKPFGTSLLKSPEVHHDASVGPHS